MAQVILDHTCSKTELVRFLRKHGIDPKKFKKKDGFKTITDLHTELTDGEAKLIWDDSNGRVTRFAHSVKLLIHTPRGYLLETGRKRGKKAPPVMKIRRWTVSGTQKPNETSLVSVIEETKEEMELDEVPQSEIKQIMDISNSEVFWGTPTVHESSVYPGIQSLVIMTRFEWNTDHRFTRKEIHDTNGVTIYLDYFPTVPDEGEEEKAGRLLFTSLFGYFIIYK